MFNHEEIYKNNLELAKDILVPILPDIDENAFNDLVENDFKQRTVESETYDRFWKIKAYMWKFNDNPYVSETKILNQYKNLSSAQKKEMDDFINNPANEEILRDIYKINRSATLCANLYHRKRIDTEFNKIGNGFEKTEFNSANDKGNCLKGLTAVLLKSIKDAGLLDSISSADRNKELWAHPEGLYKLINQTDSKPQPQPLNDYLQNAGNGLKKGMVLVINKHHAMLYTGQKDTDGNPVLCGFTPETANYALKPDPSNKKNIYAIDIPAFVEKLDKKSAAVLIDNFVKETADAIDNGKIFGKFKDKFLINKNIAQIK